MAARYKYERKSVQLIDLGWRKLHINESQGLIGIHVLSDDKGLDRSISYQRTQQVGEIDSLNTDQRFDQIRVQQEGQ